VSDTEAQTLSYVAESFHTPVPPPRSETGIVGWTRQNLFSSWGNSILTLAVLALLVWIVPGFVEWAFVRSVWNASSLAECRAIMQERFGPGEFGACWAVIHDRFGQLVYGFYPPDERWRPNLAFLLLFAAMVPVLFRSMRPLVVLMGVFLLARIVALVVENAVSGHAELVDLVESPTAVAAAIVLLAAILLDGKWARPLWLGFTLLYPVVAYFLIWGGVFLEPVGTTRLGGFLLTVIIGVTGIAASLPIGIMLALGRQSKLPALKMLCVMFIEFIRGVPLITLLFVASTLLNYFLPPGTNFDILLRVLIMVTLFASAYMAEVIRGGLASLPRGQYEAAEAMGLTYWQSMRLIILPQALKVSIPGIVNTFIGLFKDTTLVSIINLLDPLGIIKPILADTQWNGIIAELYIFIALVFFVCCFSMSRYSMFLEQRLRAADRR
jgi:general L-amino acid transport system permease protein